MSYNVAAGVSDAQLIDSTSREHTYSDALYIFCTVILFDPV